MSGPQVSPEPPAAAPERESGSPLDARAYDRRAISRSDFQANADRKSPTLAAFLSLMPGLGQVYVGYYTQGFINILVVASIIALLNMNLDSMEPLLGMFLAFFWLYNVVDAHRRANYYNQALAGLGETGLLADIHVPDKRGSLLAGVLLIVLGLVFLAHTLFHLSLEWLERWWPVGLLLVGAYLVYRSVMSARLQKEAGSTGKA